MYWQETTTNFNAPDMQKCTIALKKQNQNGITPGYDKCIDL